MNRRDFVKTGAIIAGGLALSGAFGTNAMLKGSTLKVLILGWRDYFGPTMIDTLLWCGHQVTMFNRGFTNAELYPQLNWIRGDREIADGS